MSNKNNKTDLNSEKVHAAKKARRRKLYKMMQSDKKEALLARVRVNSVATSSTFSAGSSSTVLLANAAFFEVATAAASSEQSSLTGYSFGEVSCLENMQPTMDYVILKTVLRCKFCGAKIFENETPAFYCGKASFDLSHIKFQQN